MAFEDLMLIVLGGVTGFAAGWFVARLSVRGHAQAGRSTSEAGVAEDHNLIRRRAKEDGKAKILELLEERPEITKDMVQDLLGISDALAARYLQELEQQGRIEQTGTAGKRARYRLLTARIL